MKNTHCVLRIVFLVVVMIAHSSPSYASAPYWDYDCDTYCSGGVRVNDCSYADLTYADSTPSASSVCSIADCSFVATCDSETETWYDHFGGICAGWATGAGAHGLEWFTGSCYYHSGGSTAGFFYCSYEDPSCYQE